MKEIAAIFVLLGFFTLILVGGFTFFMRKKFKDRLRDVNNEKFKQLFGTGALSDRTPNMSIEYLKYIQSSAYRALGDETLSALGDRLLVLYRVYFGMFIVSVVSMFFVINGKA